MQEMYTICETPLFTKYCLVYWTQEEYEEFKTFLALNPEAGDVEPNSGGIRKIDGRVAVEAKVVVLESSTLIV